MQSGAGRAWVAIVVALATPALAQDTAPPAAPAAGPPVAGAPSPLLRTDPGDASQPRQRLVTVFGTDPCPKPSDPDEIVVCTRRPDDERNRIPAAVRQPAAKPRGVDSSGNRDVLLGDGSGGAGGGIGSCSVNGPGGSSGCTQAQIEAWRAARREP